MKFSNIRLNIVILSLLTTSLIYCQSAPAKMQTVSVPAAGNSWVINDIASNGKIITGSGITNWKDNTSRIRTFFSVEQTGTITISIRAKVSSGSSLIRVGFGNEEKNISMANSVYDTLIIGSFRIDQPGYQWIEFQGISKTGSAFAEITDVYISGSAVEGKVYYVKDDFYFGRRGPSVHLKYEIPPEASDIVWFYNEITIPEGNDVLGSYFMADGFEDGYFGMQVNSDTERRILFSVWSPYKTDNPGSIPEEYRIIMLKKGTGVITKEFGNEGSGGQSYRKFDWKSGNTYRFLLRGQPSVNSSTDYTAYFYAPEAGKWELIASFRRPKTNNYLKSLYSFLENFMPETGNITRKGYYSNQWIMDAMGTWYELSDVKFTADATARKESRIDYSGGVENGSFFLRNCGFFSDKTNIDMLFSRPKTGNHPQINFADLE